MRERCGNAGTVESVESQRQASHSFHEPLGNLANSRRDSHIPTAPATKAVEKWKTKSRFSTFPPPRSLYLKNTKTKARGRAAARPHPNAGGAARRLQNPKKGDFPQPPISGSSRIGMNLLFQAHLALESILDFRLISGLENAAGHR